MCIFHKWKVVNSNQYIQTNYNALGKKFDKPITLILYRCSKCGEFRTDEILGSWDISGE